MRKYIFLIMTLACTLAIYGCGKKNSTDKKDNPPPADPGDNPDGTNNEDTNTDTDTSTNTDGTTDDTHGSLQLGVVAANATSQYHARLGLRDPVTPADFEFLAITSGPPDEFEVMVKSIKLRSSTASTEIFASAEGKPIKIVGSSVDLSGLFDTFECIDAAGETVTLAEGETCPCGIDEATKQPVAKDTEGNCPIATEGQTITPPVSSIEAPAGTYTDLEITYSRVAKIKGCVHGTASSESASPGPHTYCTRTDFHTFQTPLGGQNSDFEDQTAELMDMDLTAGAFTEDTTGTIDATYPISGGVEITEQNETKLTLLIDANRMLRFFNQGRPDHGPTPDSPVDRSYFFTTVFSSSSFVFVGRPGSIAGYSFATLGCSGLPIPEDHICTREATIVAGWITIVNDQAGVPFLANLMPDDDDTWTIIKGSNNRNLDGQGFTINEDGTFNLNYSLGAESTGKIFNFKSTLALGESDTNAYYEGFQDSYGFLTINRGL